MVVEVEGGRWAGVREGRGWQRQAMGRWCAAGCLVQRHCSASDRSQGFCNSQAVNAVVAGRVGCTRRTMASLTCDDEAEFASTDHGQAARQTAQEQQEEREARRNAARASHWSAETGRQWEGKERQSSSGLLNLGSSTLFYG
jgi:hypothetical protein